MSQLFEFAKIRESTEVMIAKVDMLPGTELFSEKPILCFPQQYIDQFEYITGQEMLCFAVFHKFHELTSDDQARYLRQSRTTEENVSRFTEVQRINQINAKCKAFHRKITNISLYKNILSVFFRNRIESNNTFAVFELMSKIQYSCLPNCHVDMSTSPCVCRVILPVKCGGQLTIAQSDFSLGRPVEERRQMRETACQCPRCTAPGDDT